MKRTTTAILRQAGAFAALAVLLSAATLARADNPTPYPGARTVDSAYGFGDTAARLEHSIAVNKMELVAKASASAAARGVNISGNAILMVSRNDYAVRMLAASVPAGIESPIRIYVVEDPNGTAKVLTGRRRPYSRPTATLNLT
ncbi:MAG: DUF302 domain-containing protein [Casimicrobiaceae bacterium]